MVQVNIIIFLYNIIKFWSVTKGLDSIRKKYGISKNSTIEIKIPICLTTVKRYIKIYTESDTVKHVLMKNDNDLSYINKVFSMSHDNIYGIGNLSTKQKLWNIVHTSLKKSIDLDKLVEIMNEPQNIHLLTYKCNFTYNYGDINDDNEISFYIMNIWSKYCFGKNVDVKLYSKTRNAIINILKKVFYGQRTNYIPYFGYLCATLRSWIYKNQINEMKEMIEKMMVTVEEKSFLGNFKQLIMNIEDIEYDQLKQKIITDNVLLSFLVFDFLNSFLQTAIMNISLKCPRVESKSDFELKSDHVSDHVSKSESESKQFNDRLELFAVSIKESFLFPFRMRENDQTGDLVLLNLIDSNVLFSYGPRACIGQTFTNRFYREFCKIYLDFDFIKVDPLPIIRSKDSNIPRIESKNIIKIKYSKDYLKKNLGYAEHKNLKKFYKVETIFEDISLFNYLIASISDIVQKISVESKIDYLLVSEARGFLLSAVSLNTGVPLIIARKKGRLAGETVSISYKKQYDEIETIEILTRDLTDKKIIILDDGIASGETTRAQDSLVRSLGGEVVSVIVCIKHSYTELNYNGPIHYIFDL